ncbi:McrB family protein [Brevibacillus fluminis]|uniref:McrB family protein n=1 Tax=Brevibacillus fluminis TaxID=511487 RepID=UPI003F8BF8C4
MTIKNWDIDLVGVLADNDYVSETTGKPFAVFVNRQNSIQFLIKVISQTPETFPDVRLFTCYASELHRYGFEDQYNKSDDEREEALRDFLRDNLLIFRPTRKVNLGQNEVYLAKEARLIPKWDSYHDKITLMPVPIFSTKHHKLSFEDFQTRLLTKKFVGKIDYISTEPDDTPSFVLWKHDDTRFEVIGEFDKHQYAFGGFCFSYKEPLKNISVSSEWFDNCHEEKDIMFIELNTYTRISSELHQAGVLQDTEIGSTTSAAVEIAATTMELSDPVTEEAAQPLAQEAPEPAVPASDHLSSSEETRFLELFYSITRDMGLQYQKRDLLNFHTSLKSSTLTILAGMSGTGKSKLVQAYSRALGMDDSQLNIIPVRPSWSDDADLVGFVDSLHMVYRPGDSGMINTLINAKNDENKNNKLYIICFDEMNLARVEHYFSQFLSVLELEPSRRILRLYNDDLEAKLYNSAQYPPTIPIGDNVIFVGTVNLDESTYHFSDKVLDRANVISLEIMPFIGLKELKDEKKNQKREPYSLDVFRSFKSTENGFSLSDQEVHLFWDIHQAFQTVNTNLGVGPRIVKQIDNYMKNLPKTSYFTSSDALDKQIVQRILTKLRGSEEQLQALLGTIDLHTGKVTGGSLLEILDRYHDLSPFTESRKIIDQKTRELKINGYTV